MEEEKKAEHRPIIMTHDKEYCCAENYRDVNQEKIYMAERRGCELADEFTRLEVQIAVVLFGVLGVFSSLSNAVGLNTIQGASALVRVSFVGIFFFLISSLVFGLIHIKRREIFWDGHHQIRISRYLKWDEYMKGNTPFNEAMAFHLGTAKGDIGTLSKSPSWTWIMQTICLGLAVGTIMILLIVFLF